MHLFLGCVVDVRRQLFPSAPLSKPDLGFETFIGDLLGYIRDKNIPLQNMHFVVWMHSGKTGQQFQTHCWNRIVKNEKKLTILSNYLSEIFSLCWICAETESYRIVCYVAQIRTPPPLPLDFLNYSLSVSLSLFFDSSLGNLSL